MDRVQPQTIIQTLAEMHELTHPTGKINVMAFARHAQIPEVTVKRIARGDTKQISDRVAKQLMNAFSINEPQSKGYESLHATAKAYISFNASRQDQEFLANFKKLSVSDRDEIGAFVAIKASGLTLKEIAHQLQKLKSTNE